MPHLTYAGAVMLDATPLLDAIRARGIEPGSADHSGGDYGTILWRAAKRGAISYWNADRVCVRLLGTHPLMVFGDEWLEADAMLDERAKLRSLRYNPDGWGPWEDDPELLSRLRRAARKGERVCV